ncbi:recombinase family protein [Caproicibacter fermentans]|uniref:Recombinase family protein n=1 Tax=Caproicibacter fermentans TaxID=2576756 RepID=A0A7G8T9J4_9FIRM|nr:recombinase family protein [Caproicibacter fermentans]QNK40285.1 recombinase family protein [Caproicibacter fermentans]
MLTVQQNYKVGIYVRLSKDDERAGESVSIENQKLMLTKYCEEQGWNDYFTYCDDGVSGTTFDRPGVSQLIEDAKDGKINLILVKDLSRFGRNYIQVGQFTDYLFPMIGCRFIALNDGVDTINSDNDIMPFRNLFNEFQSKDTSKKIKAVKQAHAKLGNYLGCYVPYGYRASPDDKHKFIIDEAVAENVRKMFRYRRQGLGFRKIAGLLNAEHILPPRDYYYLTKGTEDRGRRNHCWNEVTVKKMLRNEVYIGHMVQNKRGTMSYKNKKQIDKPKDEWIKVEHTHEPIIDMDTWNACAELDQRRCKMRSVKGTSEPSLFGGLLRCMDCGFKMRYTEENHTYPKKGHVKYISYMCGSYARSGKAACSAHIIYLRPLSELVLDDIRHRAKRVLEDEDRVRRELLEQKAKQNDRQSKADRTTLKATEKRLAELERLTQALYEDKVLGTVPEAVFKNLLTKYEAERVEKQSLVQSLKQKLADTAQDEHDIEQYLANIRKYVSMEQLDREMLLELINYIEIGERGEKNGQKYRDVVIHYNLVDKAG